jgi:hypothetical protein
LKIISKRRAALNRPLIRAYCLIGKSAWFARSAPASPESHTNNDEGSGTAHQSNARGKGPFIAVNCSAIPESLLESELFGSHQ